MRFRSVLLVSLILVVAGFVALNFDAVMQMTSLNLGFAQIQAPLGLVMLGMIGVIFCLFLVALMFFQASHALEIRRLTKEMAEQRNLADKAESSRFNELREFLKGELKKVADRDIEDREIMKSELQKVSDQSSELTDKLAQKMDLVRNSITETIENTGNGLSAGMGELEDRFDKEFPPRSDGKA